MEVPSGTANICGFSVDMVIVTAKGSLSPRVPLGGLGASRAVPTRPWSGWTLLSTSTPTSSGPNPPGSPCSCTPTSLTRTPTRHADTYMSIGNEARLQQRDTLDCSSHASCTSTQDSAGDESVDGDASLTFPNLRRPFLVVRVSPKSRTRTASRLRLRARL